MEREPEDSTLLITKPIAAHDAQPYLQLIYMSNPLQPSFNHVNNTYYVTCINHEIPPGLPTHFYTLT